MNTNNSPLTAFQLLVEFDPDVIIASSASVGSGWPSTFDSTLNDPTSQVQIIGAGGSVKGSALELAIIKFKCVGTGSTPISGTVVETLTTSNALLGTKDRAFLAGLGVLDTDFTGRRALSGSSNDDDDAAADNDDVAQAASSRAAAMAAVAAIRDRRQVHVVVDNDDDAQVSRRLADCGLVGDVNWDCAVSVTDLSWAMTYLAAGSLTFTDQTAQVAAMDVDMNGLVDAVDASFLLYALGNKYRFRSTPLHRLQIPGACRFDLVVGFQFSDGSPVGADGKTVVMLEIATKDNAAFLLEKLPSSFAAEATDDGVILTMAATGTGNFTATVELPTAETVQMVVMFFT